MYLPDTNDTRNINGAEAHSLGSNSFFDRLKIDFENGDLGWVGDFRDFALGYLTFASTLFAHVPKSIAKPVGAVVIGETSTGKTELANSLMRLFPEDHVICVTSLSAKSLIYRCIHDPYCLNGKVIFVEELSGLRNPDLQYLLRILVTRGEVKHVTVMNGQPVEIYAKGHISLQTTGLPADRLRDDTMNRLITIKSDASAHMTAKVIHEIKNRYADESHPHDSLAQTIPWYQRFFRELRPQRVMIPFAADLPLSGTEPESRRMAKITLDLMSTVTLLNQRQREFDKMRGVLIAEPEDFEILRQYMPGEIATKQRNLSNREMIVLETIRRLDNSKRFTYEDLMALKPGSDSGMEGGYSLTSVKYALSQLTDAGALFEDGKCGRVRFFSLEKKSDLHQGGRS